MAGGCKQVGGQLTAEAEEQTAGRCQNGSFIPSAETTMPNPYLPRETLDYIIDFLHDEPETLRGCCLISKSWVPRTRKHLFTDIKFRSVVDLESWKKTFPDPSNSPAYHTRTLSVRCPEEIAYTDGEEDGWIRAFSRVERFNLVVSGNPLANISDLEVTLTPFHGFSPALKSLHVSYSTLQTSQIFDLISSLPVLNDLTLVTDGPEIGDGLGFNAPPSVTRSPTSLAFTGTLDLSMYTSMLGLPARQLLDLPNGLHFRKLALSWCCKEDLRWVVELVLRCSDTLECLDVSRYLQGTCVLALRCSYNLPSFVAGSGPAFVDLSKTRKLRYVIFWPVSPTVAWIIATLQTITPMHRDLQRISIHIPFDFLFTNAYTAAKARRIIGDVIYKEWSDLDRFLVQFWESCSVRPKVTLGVSTREVKQNMRCCIECLFPETTKKGIIDLVGRRVPQ